jgi:hypothetical protein
MDTFPLQPITFNVAIVSDTTPTKLSVNTSTITLDITSRIQVIEISAAAGISAILPLEIAYI